jgi:hypothetical protein
MTCLHTKFHVPSSNGSIGYCQQTKNETDLHAVTALLFYILKKNFLNINLKF